MSCARYASFTDGSHRVSFDEVVGVVKEVVTERMGLQLGKVQVRIKHAPYQEGA